ncbi:hypothetical protein M758_UG065500 [Ceratodon purpureus]|nr:hypothetical protein M758_UG065500 [Ceratodon purpureus]
MLRHIAACLRFWNSVRLHLNFSVLILAPSRCAHLQRYNSTVNVSSIIVEGCT